MAPFMGELPEDEHEQTTDKAHTERHSQPHGAFFRQTNRPSSPSVTMAESTTPIGIANVSPLYGMAHTRLWKTP